MATDKINLRKQINEDNPSFREHAWDNITTLGINFVASCLCRDPKSRPSVRQLLKNSWLDYFSHKKPLEISKGDMSKIGINLQPFRVSGYFI